MAITDAELAQMKTLAEKVQYDGFVYPDEDDVIGMCSKVPHLLREVAELRKDWSYVADALEIANVRIEELRAALCELIATVDTYKPSISALGLHLDLWNATIKARAALGEP